MNTTLNTLQLIFIPIIFYSHQTYCLAQNLKGTLLAKQFSLGLNFLMNQIKHAYKFIGGQADKIL